MSFPYHNTRDSDDEFVILDSPVTERNDRIRNMAKQIDTLMVEINRQARKSKTENDKLQNTVSNLVSTVQASTAENDKLHDTVDNLKAMIHELVGRVDSSDEQAKGLHTYIKSVDREQDQTFQKHRKLNDDSKDDKQVEELRTYIENVDTEHNQTYQKLSDDNKDLCETIVTLRKDNATLQTKVEIIEEQLDKEIQARIKEDGNIQLNVDLLHEASTMKIVNLVEKVSKLEHKVQKVTQLEGKSQKE